ncbi:ribonuclease H-like domain-containing protein [Tanacetum coccineum]
MNDFCREKGIKREYSIARIPQLNGAAKRRNRTLIEVARTMLADSNLPTTFWAEVVSTAYYVQNRVLVVKPHNKTPYELFRGWSVLDNKIYAKDKSNDDSSPKEVNADGHLLYTASPDITTGASHTLEATHVEFFSDEDELEVDLGNITNSYIVPTTPNTRIHKDHPIENVISDTEPTSIAKALSNSSWVEAFAGEFFNSNSNSFGILVDLLLEKRDSGYWKQNGSLKQEKMKGGLHVKRGRDTKIPQSSGPLVKVGDEAVYKELGDRMEKAATTASSLEAEQDSGSGPRCQDTILGDVAAQKLGFETISKRSMIHLSKEVTTIECGEDSMGNTIGNLWNCIRYALTVNPIIYTSCIQQFWATAKANTVNSERQLQALIDKKKIQAFLLHSNLVTHYYSTIKPLSLKERIRRIQVGRIMLVLRQEPQQDDSVLTHSNDSTLSEKAKDAQAKEIADLKKRVQKLERKEIKNYRIKKTKESWYVWKSAQEDASNQGRSIEYIDKDAEVSLVDETQGRLDDAYMFDTDALIGNEVFAENDMLEKDQDVIPKEVSIAAPSTTATPPPVITEVEITLAQTLAKLKSAKSNVVIQEPVQNKRKAKMDKPEVPLKKKDQITLDEEMARNLEAQIQTELIKEERLARKKEEEANIALIESWGNTQAMMEAEATSRRTGRDNH